MKHRLFGLLVLFAGVAFAGGDVNPNEGSGVAAVKSPEAIQVIDRAVQAVAQAREYSGEADKTSLRKDSAGASPSRSKEIVSYRAPAFLWSFSDGGGAGKESVKVADGQSHYEFSGSTPQTIKKKDAGGFSDISLTDYPNVDFSSLSPLLMQVYSAARYRADKAVAMTYRGHELVGGVLCDVVEFTVPIHAKTWEDARKTNAALPEKPGNSSYIYYYSVDDGLLRRHVSATEIPGVSQTLSEENYTVKKLAAAEEFTFARMEAAVKPLVATGTFPMVENAHNPVGQPLPAVVARLENGRKLSWKDYRGKVLVVETWASWCGFCKKAMPFYEKMRQELASQGVVFMALNFEKEQAAYEKWVQENRSKYGFVFARAEVTEENWNDELKKFKGSLPAFYVVGRDGKVISGYTGYGYGPDKEDPRLLAALTKAGVKR